MSSVIYSAGVAMLLGTAAGWSSSSAIYKAALVRSKYRPKSSHTSAADFERFEVAGGGYERRPVTGRDVVVDDKGRVKVLADQVVFPKLYFSVGQTYRWVVIFRERARSSETVLLVAHDMRNDGDDVPLAGVTKHIVAFAGQPEAGTLFSLNAEEV